MMGNILARCGLLASLAAATSALPSPALAASAGLQALVAAQQAVDGAGAAAQKQVDTLDEATHDMINDYRQSLESVKSITGYTNTLRGLVNDQRREMDGLQADLASIETTNRDIYPLMTKMLETLGQFVALDLPFLTEQRTERVTKLRDVMGRSDVAVSEKYRRVLEAYQIELEYGRTIDAQDGTLGQGEAARVVIFLRIGRIALLYQTPDASLTGYWDKDSKSWVEEASLARNVQEGIRVAKKLGAPELLELPVPAPQGDQS